MKNITVTAKIKKTDGKAAASLTVMVQIFNLRTARWENLVSGKTNRSGTLKVSVAQSAASQVYAPQLKLKQGNSVIADGGDVTYSTRTQVLTHNFGDVIQQNVTVSRAAMMTATLSPGVMSAIRAPGVSVNTVSPSRTATANVGVTDVRANENLLGNFDSELIKFRAKEQDLLSTITQKDQLILTRDKTLETKTTRIGELEQELSTVKQSEAQLIKDNQLISAQISRTVPITNIATNIGTQFHEANKQLRAEKKPFQIGNIKVELRGAVSEDGQSMTMWKMDDLNKGVAEGGSAVKLDLVAQKEAPDTAQTVKVPDLQGLTETAAKRVLKSLGLQFEAITKSVGADSKLTIGQVMSQAPKAGASSAVNDTVRVVFAID